MNSRMEKSLGDCQNEENSVPLRKRLGARYENVNFSSEGTALTGSYQSSQIRDVGAKSVVFKNCDFSYSVFTRAYFRNAKFEACCFVGCYFRQCNFRGAEFVGCDFSYSLFFETQIKHKDIFDQLPNRPNVRKELAQTLRKNAESIGDREGALKCFRYEMEQTRRYLREAMGAEEEYYRKKYPGISNRLRFGSKLINHSLSRFIWGHGESPLAVMRFALIVWFILTSLIAWGARTGGTELTTSFLGTITFGLKHSIFLMISTPIEGFEPTTFWTVVLKGIASLSGYTVFGLMVATIVRKYARR